MPLPSLPRRGLCLTFLPAPGAYDHQAAGEHAIPGATCPNCRKPLLRLLSLDTRDPQLELGDLARAHVHLLFCWTCPLSQGFTYSLAADGAVQLVDHATGAPTPDFPWPDYPAHFAGAAVALHPAAAAASAGEQSHQVGGQPQFAQAAPEDFCPHCGGPMALLAVVADAAPDGSSMSGNDSVQVVFTLCREDRIVTCSQQVD